MAGISSRKSTLVLFVLFVCIGFYSCRQLDVYEKNVSIPNYQWKYDFKPTFDFEITDTASLYNLFVVLRHTDAYRYNNIWLDLTATLQNKDTLFRMPHLEVPLGSDEKGWKGTGMDDIWETRERINARPVHFTQKGLYHFNISQLMRENPLTNVMSIGVRVERVR